MTRYGIVSMRVFQGFDFQSTESEIVEWAMAKIRHAYPKYRFRDPHKYGFFAHDSTSYVEMNYDILASLLKDGWEPFAVDHATFHLRKRYDE